MSQVRQQYEREIADWTERLSFSLNEKERLSRNEGVSTA